MNTKILKLREVRDLHRKVIARIKSAGPELLLVILLILWFTLPGWLQEQDQTAGTMDSSTWLLILFALITFLLVLGISWWLVNRFWTLVGLPALENMVSQFKTLTSWEQLSFYLLSFALLLLAAINCVGMII